MNNGLTRAFSALFCSLLLGALSCREAAASSVTLKPSADTTLFENDPSNNLGTTTLAVGTTVQGAKSRGLVKFVLTGVPTNAVVTNVQVVFAVVKSPARSVQNSPFELHRMLTSWIEGTKGGLRGAAATTGEPTWSSRIQGSGSWGAPGGSPSSDYSGTVSASASIVSTKITFASSTGLIADVQNWLSNSNNNFGWLMSVQSESTSGTARRLGSRESPVLQQPSLVIGYSIPVTGDAPVITAAPASTNAVIGSSVSFSVTATGTAPITFQWLKDGSPIPSATSSTLLLTNLALTDAGGYSVVASNTVGKATSTAATLAVFSPVIASFAPAVGGVSMSFNAGPGVLWSILSSATVNAANWNTVTNFSVTTSGPVSVPLPTSGAQSFFRLGVANK